MPPTASTAIDPGDPSRSLPSDPQALLARLADIVGAAHVLPGGNQPQHETDWRKRWHGRALAIVRPGSTAEVAAVVQACARHGTPIVPQGGNTGLVGGATPDASGTQVVLSLARMNRVRALDAANLTLTVEAGAILQAVQQAADDAGLLFPLSLGAEGSCTIGGNLSTNAGGTQVLRFGNARELCLGLEVVGADGRVWDGLSGLRKDNTGYDLRDLFVGAEGTLGIITAATLKVFPRPAAQRTAMASCTTMARAVELLMLARAQLDASLTGFEVMNRQSLALVAAHFPQLPQPLPAAPWTVLLDASFAGMAGTALPTPDGAPDGTDAVRGASAAAADAADASGDAAAVEQQASEHLEALLGAALERGIIDDAAIATSIAQSRAMWHLRESISLAQAEEGLNIKHDISLPVSAIPAFVETTDAAIASAVPGVRMVDFGHLGDGNLHYNVQSPVGIDAAAFLRDYEGRINDIVYDAVIAHGGSISAEHGVGQLKRDELPHRKSAVALDWMHRLKAAFDPQGLLNPGKVLQAR